MVISQQDVKLLWGRSGNRCAICKVELSQDSKSSNSVFPIGEQAHIVGEKHNAPRGNSSLTDAERNSYYNLILLCPNHHTIIDKDEKDWPVEKLYLIKSQHELWVQQSLSRTREILDFELLPPVFLNDDEEKLIKTFSDLENEDKFDVKIEDFRFRVDTNNTETLHCLECLVRRQFVTFDYQTSAYSLTPKAREYIINRPYLS